MPEGLTPDERLKAVSHFAGELAHSLNNVLTVVTGYCELLLRRIPEGEKHHKEIAEISRAADRASDLLSQLLVFGRRQPGETSSVDLNALIEGLRPGLRSVVGDGIEIRTKLASDLPAVRVVSSQLEAALIALAQNAREAMEGVGILRLQTATATSGEGFVELDVIDTGRGMEGETLARALEPFFTTKREGEGAGLGLSTVYGVVSQNGGRLRLESTPGAGTVVHIHLPVAGILDA